MLALTADTVLTFWWGVAATAVAWVCLPNLMQLLGQTQIESGSDEDAAALEPPGDDPEYAALFADLQRLGFVPLGVRRTTCRFFCGHWVKTFHVLTFATPQRDCFATVFRFFKGDPWRLCYLTALTDGGLVESANQMEGFKVQEEGYWRWGFATPDREELLRLHRELVDQYCAAGGCPVDHPALEQLGELVVKHEGRWYRKGAAAMALAHLMGTLIMIAIPALAMAGLAGWGSFLVPLAVLVATVRHITISMGVLRRVALKDRSEDAAASRGRASSSV
jgi:hypothetical protein